jgi:hypothetical protein
MKERGKTARVERCEYGACVRQGRGGNEVRVRERGLGGPFRSPPTTGTAPGLLLICRLDRLV